MTLPIVREHTDAVIAALQATGLTVGDSQAPAGAPPYGVVYPISGGDSYGTLGDRNGDAELVYQVTCVGSSRKQAEWVADKALGLLAGFAAPTGRSVPLVALESMPGIQRDDEKSPPLFYATPRFRVFSTPS